MSSDQLSSLLPATIKKVSKSRFYNVAIAFNLLTTKVHENVEHG